MSELLTWAVAHPAKVTAGVVFVLNLVNAVLRKGSGWDAGLGGKIHLVLDRLSFLTRHDGEGTLKLPGGKSR